MFQKILIQSEALNEIVFKDLNYISPNRIIYEQGEIQTLTFTCDEDSSCDFELFFDGFRTRI